YHRPCDVVVPIDSNYVYWGISWCFTNGYNCYGFKNVPMVYGSRILSNWNSNRGYGYQVMDDFTNDSFPYDFFATYGCLDQVTNPCHGVDNRPLREGNLAKFFANLTTTPKFCTTRNIADQNQK